MRNKPRTSGVFNLDLFVRSEVRLMTYSTKVIIRRRIGIGLSNFDRGLLLTKDITGLEGRRDAITTRVFRKRHALIWGMPAIKDDARLRRGEHRLK